MSVQMWVRSHVERLLQEEWKTAELRVDLDGDYRFRGETSACWVGIQKSGWGEAPLGMALDVAEQTVNASQHEVTGERGGTVKIVCMRQLRER